MEVGQRILAIITLKGNEYKVGGGVPIFFVDNEEEQDEISMLLARLLMGMVHDLGNDVNIIIRH
ncbi:MAG: capping complex subunit for YIEGIA [Bacillota bacterium]